MDHQCTDLVLINMKINPQIVSSALDRFYIPKNKQFVIKYQERYFWLKKAG